MDQLVFRGANDQAMTNSLLVAEKFGKEHRHVLDSIRSILMTAENSALLSMFIESTYYSSQNKELPMYIISRDGFTLLVMGFNGKDALNFKLEFLNAFNKMESMLKSDDYILARSQEILNNRLQLATQKVQILESTVEKQVEQIQLLAPKASYTDEVLQSTATYTLTQIAHDLGMRSVFEFTGWCKSKGFLFQQSGQWQPTAKVAGKGYFTTRTARFFHSDGSVGSSLSTVVTELGRAWLHSQKQNEKLAG
jgi:Rha family phage regulatory protein